MIQSSGNLLRLISEALATPDGPVESGNEIITIQSVCRRLLQHWPRPLSPAERESLHALCRKVHTAGTLSATYKFDWKKSAADTEFQKQDWDMLAATFAAWSTPPGTEEVEETGMGLKCLNALWQLLERRETAEHGCDSRRWIQCAEENTKAWFSGDAAKDRAA